MPECYICGAVDRVMTDRAGGLPLCELHDHQVDNEIRAVLGEPLRRHYYFDAISAVDATARKPRASSDGE
jgi:hypothetical protein